MTDTATLRDRLTQSRQPLVVGWCTYGSAFAAETVARGGVDVVCLDLEHGMTDWDGTLASVLTLTAASIPVLLRTGSHHPGAISRALDAGCDGVIVPHIESVEEAVSAVSACRYPPSGHRSWGPTRAALLRDADPLAANDRAVCIPMLESAAAAHQSVGIAATAGVAAVLVGSNDLCLDLATETRPAADVRTSPDFHDILAEVADACSAAGVPAGAPAATDEEAELLRTLGYRLLVLPSDVALLGAAVSDASNRIRGGDPADRIRAYQY